MGFLPPNFEQFRILNLTRKGSYLLTGALETFSLFAFKLLLYGCVDWKGIWHRFVMECCMQGAYQIF